MKDKLMENNICRDLIQGNCEYEVPNFKRISGQLWKGKADVVNHDEKLIIDLKTTGDINKFKNSAWRFNYDSQAYIYSTMFGYEFLFIVIDKNTNQIGMFDCSPQFYESGQDKVQRAVDAYDLFFATEDFDPKQYFISKTL